MLLVEKKLYRISFCIHSTSLKRYFLTLFHHVFVYSEIFVSIMLSILLYVFGKYLCQYLRND